MTPTLQASNALERIARQCDRLRNGLLRQRTALDQALADSGICPTDAEPIVKELLVHLHAASYQADHLYHLLNDQQR